MRGMRRRLKNGAAAVAVAALLASVPLGAQGQDAKQLYEKQCGSCHGAGGKGDGPVGKILKPPPGDFATTLKGTSDADVIKIIKEGGKPVGKSVSMPAYGSKLSDDQIKEIVQYIKGLSH